LKSLAVCSNGRRIPALQHFRLYETRLATAQRAGNRARAKAIHAKIKNSRRDHVHKATAKLAAQNQVIAVGNVNSSKLAKTRMSKSVLDASWSTFRAQLEYKARRHRAEFIVVDEKFTSRTCSSCGTIPASSPKGMGALGIRLWECSECGAIHDRDMNAAINILNVALSAERRADESWGTLQTPRGDARIGPREGGLA
jgi:IS605 OrfB family transposase